MTIKVTKPVKDRKLNAGFTLSESIIKTIISKAKEAGMNKSMYLDELLKKVFKEGE